MVGRAAVGTRGERDGERGAARVDLHVDRLRGKAQREVVLAQRDDVAVERVRRERARGAAREKGQWPVQMRGRGERRRVPPAPAERESARGRERAAG